MRRTNSLVWTLVLLVQSAAATALAQPAVTQNTDRVVETAPSTDSQNWTASAGAALSTGNTRSYSFNGGTQFTITRGHHGFGFESVGSFGRADPAETAPDPNVDEFVTNTRNVQSKLRYDYFFTTNHAGFISGVHRWDTFSGLDVRVQAQAGYQYNFIREEKHRLWTEIGYDFTFDNIHGAMDANVNYHSVRGFVGWDIHTNESVAFKTGVEALFNVQEGEDWRINWENTLSTQVVGQLSIEIKFNMYYDHQPVVGKEALDTRSTLNLVFDMW